MHEVFNKDFFWERLIDFFYGPYRLEGGVNYKFKLASQDLFEFYYVARYFSKIIPPIPAKRLGVLRHFRGYIDRSSFKRMYKTAGGISFYIFNVEETGGSGQSRMAVETIFMRGCYSRYKIYFKMDRVGKLIMDS